MKILAIETATEACSAALSLNGEVIERFEVAPRRHTELILPMVDDLLAQAALCLKDLDALAFGRGPGAFTGLRIAAGVVQGLALGADRPVAPVSTLAALALEAFDECGAENALVALDARMEEVYWGVFRRKRAPGLLELMEPETVLAPEKVILPRGLEGEVIGIGSGWKVYGEVLSRQIGDGLLKTLSDRLPRAGRVAKLAAEIVASGAAVAAEEALPVYLRNQVVRTPQVREKKS